MAFYCREHDIKYESYTEGCPLCPNNGWRSLIDLLGIPRTEPVDGQAERLAKRVMDSVNNIDDIINEVELGRDPAVALKEIRMVVDNLKGRS